MSVIKELCVAGRSERLRALDGILCDPATDVRGVPPGREVNNHVHTFYSFSPYSPAAAAYLARAAGLAAVGIMDHDSVSGAGEMLDAGARLGLAVTVGCEIRVGFSGTPFGDRKINNPDSRGIVYMALHGIPSGRLAQVDRFLRPIRAARNSRNRDQVERLNILLGERGLDALDFERDVAALSMAEEGGSVTERHILQALSLSLIEAAGGRPGVRGLLRGRFSLEVEPRLASLLDDEANPHYVYDLIGVLKSSFLPHFFVQPGDEECIPVPRAVAFAREVGAIPAYAYLGDVGESPTGDKKAERFEDAFLDELMAVVKDLGFQALTYMPPRNTEEQLRRVRDLCRRFGFMEISGVDINSSRQSFTCPIITQPQFAHLMDATWALVAHEKLSDIDARLGLFHPGNPLASASLERRMARYAALGLELDHTRPLESARIAAGRLYE